MKENRRGGYRKGSGRRGTGRNCRCYTVTFPLEEAAELEKLSKENEVSVNKYIRNLVRKARMYMSVHLSVDHVDTEKASYEKV